MESKLSPNDAEGARKRVAELNSEKEGAVNARAVGSQSFDAQWQMQNVSAFSSAIRAFLLFANSQQ